MSALNVIAIGAIAHATNINLTLEAMGRGPNSLSRSATSTANPTWETAATHKYMSDQGVTVEFAAILHGFANGDLPPLPDGVVWGVDGVISAADALAAITAENFAFASFNEAFTPGEQVAAALDALGLAVVPDPPL